MDRERREQRGKPRFFMLGAPKCGTTALASYLAMHPALRVSEPKEPNYFCSDLEVGQSAVASDEEYVAKYFAGSSASTATALLDASVWYLYSSVAVDAILRFQPDARFLVMVRNPVDMAYSLHSMLHFMGQEDVFDFAQAWELGQQRRRGLCLPAKHWIDGRCLQYKAACSLGTQLESLLVKVDRARVHIELQEDLQKDSRGVYARVLDFMGVPDDGRVHFPQINAGRKVKSRYLVSVLRAPMAVSTANVVKRALGLKSLGIGRPDVPMRAEERRMLVKAFDEEILRMENLLGRNLSHWRRIRGS